MTEMTSMKTYKATEKDLTCKGFKFEVGKEYETEGTIKCCNNGFHSCENPLDIFNYYAPNNSRFFECEASGDVSRDNDNDTKVATRKIKLLAELNIKNLVEASIQFISEKAVNKGKHCTGDRSASSATGDSSASSATGYRSASSATGDRSASSATGYSSASSATGDSSASSATGYSSASSATGYRSASSATGDRSASSATGDSSASIVTGECSEASVDGKKAIACALGYDCKAKGKIGCWLVLVDRYGRKNDYKIKDVKAVIVDGEEIKKDTYYKLVSGEVVEC
ncbi:MAG: hypothetical protein PUK21_01395 [Peptostreptococcaceae bacterium]|nr:hypothetical protein [Peptostreptococcaceae bacterium]